MLLVENRQLLDRFRKGDRRALEEVYVAYAQEVSDILRHGFTFSSAGRSCRYHGTRSQFDLEDRLHDVFARAFTDAARMRYDGLTPYIHYLRTITRNLVIDDFRKKEHALIDYSIEQADVPAPPDTKADPIAGEVLLSGLPDLDAESAELARLVQTFKPTLKDRERTVYELRFEQEFEHHAIAGRTGLSPSQIKTSEARIRRRFFQFMQQAGYFVGYQQERKGWLKALWSRS